MTEEELKAEALRLKGEADKLAKDKADYENLIKAKEEADKLAKAKAEADKLAKDKADAETSIQLEVNAREWLNASYSEDLKVFTTLTNAENKAIMDGALNIIKDVDESNKTKTAKEREEIIKAKILNQFVSVANIDELEKTSVISKIAKDTLLTFKEDNSKATIKEVYSIFDSVKLHYQREQKNAEALELNNLSDKKTEDLEKQLELAKKLEDPRERVSKIAIIEANISYNAKQEKFKKLSEKV